MRSHGAWPPRLYASATRRCLTRSAIVTSDLEALPHQIKAVYGELLPRTPLRFLLADDAGSGKTIKCGPYVKELLLRGDLARCLIVAPGSLVEQWMDELYDKFGLSFEVLTQSLIDASVHGNVFDRHPLLIAKNGSAVPQRRPA